ncbi:extracellular solute-binding protein [Dactylosporangium sp. AC04546]|uniref:extracellular solute-binding protein n=1 Tax=Dactylosporangium sp. AC04546 TaxID=2862460 RepID=UPI001EE06B81|nr:extracellular solute-binding protein [Dactylosporangium sp. AC04546]WVK80119.1 extracellular solute-binding protein [Dactylosporangium sp. AC04546]
MPTRRTLLRGAAAAAVSGPLLAACGDGDTGSQNTTERNQGVKLPAYAPSTVVKPDLPGNADGLLDAFLSYPDPPVQQFTGPPLKGGTVSAFVLTGSPVPPPKENNPFWQELDKRLGTELKLTITPSAEMAAKFSTLITGDDLPDLIVPALFLPNGVPAGIGNLPQWMATKCTDLTEYLGGDAVKEYPNLAAISTAAWKQCVYNGGIYGVPVPRGVAGTLMFRRDDLVQKLGVDPDPKSFAEFRDFCRKVTDAKANRWAIVNAGGLMFLVQQMLGGPNGWRWDGTKLTHQVESEEFRKALSDVVAMYKEGVVHPDSFANNAPTKRWFNAGEAVLTADRYTAWPQYYAENVAGPAFRISGMRPPKYDGGGFASTWQSSAGATNNFTVFKKADKGRIKELLTLCNYLAAPFGTAEFLFRRYGVAGTHYTMQNGGPVYTQAGVTQTALGVRYIVDAPDAIFIPGNPEATKSSYEYQKAVIATSVPDPVIANGLFSDEWSRKQPVLGGIVNNGQNDIIAGRQPLSHLDEMIKNWRSQGGDKVRQEFTEQLQKLGVK